MADVPVSIVIRTLNAAATLRPVLEALRRNPDDQLILVDSGSTDGTLEIAERHGCHIHHITHRTFKHSHAIDRDDDAGQQGGPIVGRFKSFAADERDRNAHKCRARSEGIGVMMPGLNLQRRASHITAGLC